MRNYWKRRFSRRQGLLASSTAALGAAFLAACGGGSSDGGPKAGDQPSLLTQPADTFAKASRTGLMKDRTFGDTATLDILAPSTTHNSVGPLVYSALFQFKPGHLKPTEYEVAGDAIEAWETSPDGLTVTGKLRQGMKFHDKAPINGRAVDAQDVVVSWDRFSRLSSGRIGVANVADPTAPVLSVTATDNRTVVIKLMEPLVYATHLFSENLGGRPLLLPKEVASGWDPKTDLLGTGPFVLTRYTPSVGYSFKRNPDYYDKDFALVETVEMPIVPEYATALAQLKAGNIYSMGSGGNTPKVRPEDILPTKRDEPRLQVYPADLGGGGPRLGFGYLPKSPFFDERVRQAFSMAIDRDLYMDTFLNVSKFESEGLKVESRWNTALQATFDGWWLDPKSKDFGPNSRYYQRDLSETKKLLSAAGFPSGMKDVPATYITSGELGELPKQSQVIEGMLQEAGIVTKFNPVDYNTQYIPKYRDNLGRFDGIVFKLPGGGTKSEPIAWLASEFWSKGGVTFYGFDAAGKGDQSGDPAIESLIEKGRIEKDVQRRKAIVADLQRLLAKAQYGILPSGVATSFLIAWPALGNFRVHQGGRLMYRLWLDETKAPIAKS